MLTEASVQNGRSPIKTAVWQGIKSELPITIGVIPFGMIYGVLGLSAGPNAAASPGHVVGCVCWLGTIFRRTAHWRGHTHPYLVAHKPLL